ncbi:uncharacterized protein LOC132181410 isoform X2 [Corylus avellana]|uniref:uncharacterized protein LOC132181410 isoform X2 n=1 Tax=Corylus avellana TaxID=13451 RepID=UPI00286CC476|nr:uncharacterized protein LOC132181410 isoform X2 [Corylus avellana]
MVVVEASKLKLPTPSISSFPPLTTSLLFEPQSLSLALMHSDSSFSLYPSLSPLSLSSLPPPQTLIPSPSSSSTFLLLQNPSPNPRALFVVSGPYRGGSSVLLRFYVLLRKTNSFARARLVCNQRGLRFDDKLGVLVDVNHGVSVRLSGSVNFFAMHSVSSSKIFVFAVRTVGDDGDEDGGEDGVVLKLMRCAVIECSKPVFSISVSSGFLILGEESGVRVFNLRPLVKGRVRKVNNLSLNSNLGMNLANGKLESRGFHLPNGLIGEDYAKHGGGKNGGEGASWITRNGYLDGRVDKHYRSVKQSSIKLRQDSSEGGACFVAFRSGEIGSSASTRKLQMSVKAISIQALSPKKFVILDSVGELHLLHLSNSVIGSDSSCHMKQLPHIMEVQKLAVFPDVSIRNQTVWISDGCYSVHMMAVSDMDAAVNENGRNESEEKLMQISVRQFSLVKRWKILLLWLRTLF